MYHLINQPPEKDVVILIFIPVVMMFWMMRLWLTFNRNSFEKPNTNFQDVTLQVLKTPKKNKSKGAFDLFRSPSNSFVTFRKIIVVSCGYFRFHVVGLTSSWFHQINFCRNLILRKDGEGKEVQQKYRTDQFLCVSHFSLISAIVEVFFSE